MTALDLLIAEARSWRREHHFAKRRVEAAAAALREKALLDARAAILGRIEPQAAFLAVYAPPGSLRLSPAPCAGIQ